MAIPDYYRMLQIPRTATSREIKSSYRKLAVMAHPDKNPHDQQRATIIFQMLSTAYTTLSDSDKKRKYDDNLRQSETRGDHDISSEAKQDLEAIIDACVKGVAIINEAEMRYEDFLEGYGLWRRLKEKVEYETQYKEKRSHTVREIDEHQKMKEATIEQSIRLFAIISKTTTNPDTMLLIMSAYERFLSEDQKLRRIGYRLDELLREFREKNLS